MAKKIVLISSLPVCIVLAALAVVFVGIGRGQPVENISIESARSQVFDLIAEDKWAQADAAVDRLITDYSADTELPFSMTLIADTYTWQRKYDGADRLYRAVIEKSPNTEWDTKARLGLARLEVLELIGQKEYAEANQRIDVMTADFQDEPDLATALFHIGQDFFWQRFYGEAKDAFDRGVEMFPYSPASEEMQLWSAKAGVCALIYGRRATDKEIITEIDKLINDFNVVSGLPEAVYWIGKEYEWTNGTHINRAGWYDAPNSAYQRLMQEFGDTPYGQQAEWDQKRLNHRMKIFNLMSASADKKEPDQNAVDAAIEEMVADLQGRPETAGELYWIACGYEEKDDEANNKGAEAMRTYERIVQDFPESKEADKAVLDIQKRIITDSIIAGDINGAEVLMDEFAEVFKDHPYAGTCLGRVAIGEFKRGYKLKETGQIDNAKQHFEEAVKIFERIITNNLKVEADDGYLCYYLAATHQQLKQWEQAIQNYQKVADDYPNFEYVCGAEAGVGWCYEAMVRAGAITKEQANPAIEQAYTTVLSKYPDCYIAHYAAFQLAVMSEAKGDKTAAVGYYRLFLELAKPGNSRIASAEAKLAILEGTN